MCVWGGGGGGGGGVSVVRGSFTHTHIYIYIKPLREECASVQNMGVGWGGGGMTHKLNWTLCEVSLVSVVVLDVCVLIHLVF